MSNYDHDILGVGNPNHPANEEDVLEPEFNSNELNNAFEYYLETGDEINLKSVFEYHNLVIQKSIDKLTYLVILLRAMENTYNANKICKEIEQLKTLLK